MKDFTEFIDGTFDAKAFAENRLDSFQEASNNLNTFNEMGFANIQPLKTILDQITEYLTGFISKPTNSHDLFSNLQSYQTKVESWLNSMSEDEKDFFKSVADNMELDCKKAGKVTFSDMLLNSSTSESIFNEHMDIKAGYLSFEETEIKNDSEFNLIKDEENEPENEFSLFSNEGAEPEKNKSKVNRLVVDDSQFQDKLTRMEAGQKLFPKGMPALDDIKQTFDGSCYMLATLRQMVKNDPLAIKNLITENSDNKTVTLHFFKEDSNKNKIPLDVVVDKTLPPIDKECAPWVRLIEKGYAASNIKKIDVQKSNKISTSNIAYFDAGSFYDSLVPGKIEGNNLINEIADQPDLNSAKNKYSNIISDALRDNAIITITTKNHVMDFKNITTKNGKTILNYHDQFSRWSPEKSIALDDLFKNSSAIDTLTIIKKNPVTNKTELSTISNRNLVEEINKRKATLNVGNHEKIVREEYRHYLLNREKQLPVELTDSYKNVSEIIRVLDSNQNTKKLISDFFKAYSNSNPKATVGDYIKNISTPEKRNQFLGNLFTELNSEVEKDLLANNPQRVKNFRIIVGKQAPDNSQLNNPAANNAPINNAPISNAPINDAPINNAPVNMPIVNNSAVKNDISNNPSEQKPNSEINILNGNSQKVADKYQQIRTVLNEWDSQRKRSENSKEFNAMADALKDMCDAYDLKASPEKVTLLQERAFAKCDHYLKCKSPHTGFGKDRVEKAQSIRKNLLGINPLIKMDMEKGVTKEAVALEISTLLADRFINKHQEAFRKSPTDNTVDPVLRHKLIMQWSDNKTFLDFGAKFKNNNKQTFLEKMCLDENKEALITATERFISAEKENAPTAQKSHKKLEKEFGVIGGPVI